MKRVAIVTGASSGMGMEFVKQIIRKYDGLDEIWVIARRTDKLIKLSASVSTDRCKIVCITADLTDDDQREGIAEILKEEKPFVKILVNAAGYGLIGNFKSIGRNDVTGMTKLNCVALADMTRMCLSYMKKGSIIYQFASAAAFLPQPGFAVYAATKSFVLSLSRALDRECRKRKITVTAVCPGPVMTEFFDIAEQTGKINPCKKLVMAKPGQVVAKAISDGKKGKSISIYGVPMKIAAVLSKLLPQGLLMKFF